MKLAIALVAGLLFVGSAQAQRLYNQGELDAMLAPIALQPDGVVSQVLIASTYPDEVAAAARWSRANPHLRGEDAVRAVQYEPWDPAVKALVAFPELLLRMDESPQWLHDLGEAFLLQEAHVMDTVQALRRRAQAAGHLATTDQYAVYQQDQAIVVQPRTQIVYVRYYDPYVVYGPWWWPYYRPVFWRPWAPRPVFVTYGFFYSRPDWHHRHVYVVHRPVHVRHQQHDVVPGKWRHRDHDHRRQCMIPEGCGPQHRIEAKPHAPRVDSKPHVRVPESQRRPIVQSTPLAAPPVREASQRRETLHVVPGKWQHRNDAVVKPRVVVEPHVRVPESHRRPIVQSAPLAAPPVREASQRRDTRQQVMPAASGFTQQQGRREQRSEVRREHRGEARHEQRGPTQRGHPQRGRDSGHRS